MIKHSQLQMTYLVQTLIHLQKTVEALKNYKLQQEI